MEINSIVFFIVVTTVSVYCQEHWSYDAQDEWPAKYCLNSITQSPIDIVKCDLVNFKQEPIRFINWERSQNGTIVNNGHSVTVEIPAQENVLVRGLGLPGTYKLEQFHFHWSSEHTVDGNRFPFEAHFVLRNTHFESLPIATEYTNGVAVIGILYELSQEDNPVLQPIVDQIAQRSESKRRSGITIKPIEFLPKDWTRFYRYQGSLTTPNCNDGVLWTIFQDTSRISQKQVQRFTYVRDDNGNRLIKNFRDTQPLNERLVFNIRTRWH